MRRDIRVTINGEVFEEYVELRLLLVDFIREIAGRTGTHVGCGYEGRCGACTVVFNGRAIKSCLMLAVQAHNAEILTVEGLARGEDLHPIQKGFRDRHGLQCGFCTPGFLMTMYDYLKDPSSEEEDIRHAMSGVLCRCTGYVHIIEAVQQAIREVEEMTPAERARWFPL